MKKLTVVMVPIFILLLVTGIPSVGEGAKDIQCIPDLSGTSWSGSSKVVNARGFSEILVLEIEISEQEGNLFTGEITRFDHLDSYDQPVPLPVPIFGAIVECREIRISTGNTVLIATINKTGEVISGYLFSTDGLEPDESGGWESNPDPAMCTFELIRTED